jgi:hypothetical protein
MYNRVQFMLRLSLLQKFKNKETFVINKKLRNQLNINNNLNKFNNTTIRKIHSSSNSKQEQPPNPFDIIIIIASIICGTLFVYKKK